MQRWSYEVNPEYAKLTQIVPGLFICGISELNRCNIERNEITMIVNATNEVSFGVVWKFSANSNFYNAMKIE